MANFTPIAALRAFLESGTTATARTNIGLGNVDDTTDLLKPISAATQTAFNGVDDALDLKKDGTIRLYSSEGPTPHAMTVDEVDLFISTNSAEWTITLPPLTVDGTNLNETDYLGPYRISVSSGSTAGTTVNTVAVAPGEVIEYMTGTGGAWTYKLYPAGNGDIVTATAGVISDALTFSGQQELTGQLLTTGDSTVTRDLGDARYSAKEATEILVTQASDLSGALDSSIAYKLDGFIAMGSTQIIVPVGGLTIVGGGNNISGLTTSQTSHTLFIDSASDAGSLTLSDFDIKVDGLTSKVYDLDNSGAGGIIRISNVSYTDCTEIGEFDAFFAALFSDMVWFNAGQGMTFSGTWGGGINTNGFVPVNLSATGTAFKEGTSLVLGSRFISNANMNLQAGAVGFNFSESNFSMDGEFELLAGTYSGAGTPVTGITRGNTKCKWRDNNGLSNTYVGARWSLTTEIATSIGASNTYVKLAGTTTYADEQWFSNATDNAFVYDSTNPIECVIAGTMSLSAGNNNQVQVKVVQWDDSISDYIDIHEHGPITMSGAGVGENISILGYADLEINDRIEVWVQNLSAATDITMLEGTLISTTERAN